MEPKEPKRNPIWKWSVGGVPILAIVGLVVLLGAGIALGASVSLNKTFPATGTIQPSPTASPPPPPPMPTQVTLYTDALATTPIPDGYIHDFGTVAWDGTLQKPLWFKADEIDPSTVQVTATGLPAGGSLVATVGTPDETINGRPTELMLKVEGIQNTSTTDPIVLNFTVTVTGTGTGS